MSLKLPQAPGAGLFKQGTNAHSSEDGAVERNIDAVAELANIVRTSLGPAGRNKIVVNHLAKVFLTSDASTILSEIEVVHPAVKVVVMAAQQQKAEFGDASNLVVVFAGELLKQARDLLRIGMAPSEILVGYDRALGYALESLDKQKRAIVSDVTNKDDVYKVVKNAVSSEKIAKLASEAVSHVMPSDPKMFNTDNVRVVKIMGASLASSHVVKGMVLNRAPEGQTKEAHNVKVAVFTAPVDISATETKGTVLLNSADDMLGFSKGEEDHMHERIKQLAEAGVGVVIAGSGVGALALHFLNRFNILVLKIASKFDLQRVCRVCGASALPKLCTPSPEQLGEIESVEIKEIGGDKVTVLSQESRTTRTATVVLRGATKSLLDEQERAVDDAVAAVRSLTKDTAVVPGAGAAELAIAADVIEEGERTSSTLQYAIKRFGRALEVIPSTLAENAGQDPSEALATAYAAHSRGNTAMGINAHGDGLIDCDKKDVWDVACAMRSALELATQAAGTVLSVDMIIMAKPAGGPKVPKQGGDWDQD